MSFELKTVVPWGRNLLEYQAMFSLSNEDLRKKIISFGDGPASFNAEQKKKENSVFSLDPVYAFSKKEIAQRIQETKEEVYQQVKSNIENFVWKDIKSPEDLLAVRLTAMEAFLEDFDKGINEGRYIAHSMPEKTPFVENSFDIGLSSHFLILYSKLGLSFHIESITEMLRVCKEIRIFPLVNLNSKKSEVLEGILAHFGNLYTCKIDQVDYEFQKGANKMLVIKKD